VTGVRRRHDLVVARPVVTAVTVAVVFMSFGNLLAAGCVIAWLRSLPVGDTVTGAVWMFGTVAVTQFAGGVCALIAWSWSR